jgi:chaperone modulatory protein CbpM
METREFLLHAHLDPQELEAWIAAGWLMPGHAADARFFSDIDVARAQLIHDLKTDMGVNDEGVAIILDLLDQVYGLRGTLRDIASAVAAQHDVVRRQIIADIRASSNRTGAERRQRSTAGQDKPQ